MRLYANGLEGLLWLGWMATVPPFSAYKKEEMTIMKKYYKLGLGDIAQLGLGEAPVALQLSCSSTGRAWR